MHFFPYCSRMEIVNGLYQLKVPVPNNPVGFTLPYVFEVPGGASIIDPGWDADVTWQDLTSQLGEVGVSMRDIKQVIVTHVHPDHYGLAGQVKERSGATVVIHQRERDLIRSRYMNPQQLLDTMGDWLAMHGVPKEGREELKTSAMPVRSFVDPVLPDEVVWGGEKLEIGRFNFEVWWTPGHSPGHICFLERGKKFILTGDHVLPTITPNISLHPQQP